MWLINIGNRRVRSVALLTCGAVLLAAAVSAVILLVGQREHDHALAAMAPRMVAAAQVRALALEAEIDSLRNDVLFLRQVPPVAGLVRAVRDGDVDRAEQTPGRLWRSRFNTIMVAFMQSNRDISQIVLYDATSAPLVLGGVGRGAAGIVPLQAGQPQTVSIGEAIGAASRLRDGQAWVAPLSADTTRLLVSTPVFDAQASRVATLVVAYDIAPALRRLRTSLGSVFVLYLLDADGRDLLAASSAVGARWDRTHIALPTTSGEPAALQRVAAAGGIVHIRSVTLNLAAPGSAPRLLLGFSDAALATAVRQAQLAAGGMVGGALLLSAILALALAYQWSRRRDRMHRAELAAIADNSHDAIIGQDGAGRITSWNRGAERLFGYPRALALGQSADVLSVPPSLHQQQQRWRAAVLASGTAQSHVTVRCCADGSEMPVMTTLSPLAGARGRIVGAAETIRDLTPEQEHARQIEAFNLSLEQQVLQRTSQIASVMGLQRAILDHAGYAVIATDLQGVITLFNPAAEAMLGYRAQQMIGTATPALFHDPAQVQARAATFSAELGEDIEAGFAVFVVKALRGLPNEHEWTYIRADSATLTVRLSVTALRAGDGIVSGYLGMAVDVSAVHAQEQALHAQHRFLDTVTEGLPGMVAYWDADLICRFANHAYLAWFGRPRDKMLGLHLRTLLGEKLFADNMAPIRAALAGVPQHFERQLTMADGEQRHTWAHYIPDVDKGQVRGFIVLVSDVSALKRAQLDVEALNRELEARTEQAESASRAKSVFLANMSHEIRTPMNAVLGMLQLLRLSELDERQSTHAIKADTAARSLLGVLDDILDFSRVEAGKLQIDPQPFALDDVLRNVAVIVADGVGDKPIELVLMVAPDVPHDLLGDALRLQQILINICGNATKFTAAGEVTLRVRRAAANNVPLALHFSVTDTGIGIPAAQCTRIFEGFSQAEASTARRYGGSGLGLAISQRLAHLMEGTLTVGSTPGVGSCFDLIVPLQARLAGRPLLPAPAGVLLIEPNRTTREALSGYFDAAHWPATTLAGGAAALAHCEQAMPAVVYVSVAMADITAQALVGRLRQIGQGRPLRLIGLMASHAAELRARSLGVAALFDAVLVKPVVSCDLLAAASAPPPPPPSLRQGAVLAGVRVLLVEDNALNQQVAGELLRIAGAAVVVASSGAEALAAFDAGAVFDVVLMDVQMPGMDGFTATGLIRSKPGLERQVIIAVTANAMADDRSAALAAGMNDHLGKPFDLERLCEIILRHTGLASAAAASVISASASASASVPVPLAQAAALARMGGSVPTYRRALASFGGELDRFDVAADAACAQGEPLALMACCHAVKGVSAMIGAVEMAAAAGATEAALRGGAPVAAIEREALRRAAAQARTAVDGWLAANPAPAPEGGPGDALELPLMLARLQRQLTGANLAALDTFEALREPLARRAPEQCAALAAAIGQLQFNRAAALCGALQEHTHLS